MYNMIRSDHRKESLQVNQPIFCIGLTRRLEQRHIWLWIPMWQTYIYTDQSIVQVTHSHNPFSLRRIPFNSTFIWHDWLKGNIQIHGLLFSIIHTCSNEILLFLLQVINDWLQISIIYLLYKGPEIPCLRIIGKCININTAVRSGNTKVCKL